MDAIETRGLSKEYRKFFSLVKNKALDDLDLQVPSGCVFGFLGLNGAGKTTTIKLLLGLAYPTGGTGSVLGRPIGDLKAKEKIGFLPEEAYFQRHLSAVDFLNFCARTLHMEPKLRKERVQEMLELVGLKDKAKSKLLHFSKGMLQRVGVAQALLNDPDLIIFDEPLTGLDPKGRTELKEIMLGLKEKGKTVFFSSHILSDVQAICDRIAILNKGKMIFQGKVEDILEPLAMNLFCKEVPAIHLEALEKISGGLSKEGDSWQFQANDDEQKEKIEAYMAKNSLKLERISISYSDLEPVFLEHIEADNQNRGLSP